MNSTIYQTCQLITEPQPLIDTGALLLKAQIIPLLIIFFGISLAFLLISTSIVEGGMKKKNFRKHMFFTWLATSLVSFISYIIILSYDFGFFREIIETII